MTESKTFFGKWGTRFLLKDKNPDWKQYLQYIPVSLLLSIFTFPNFLHEILPGFDGSENFAFCYLFSHHIQYGTHIVFTYGPLGFICTPLFIGNSLSTAIFLCCFIRIIFIYCFLILGFIINKTHRILHLILIIGLCNIMYIDMALIGGCILAILIYHLRKKLSWIIIGCFLASIALLVKSSYGIMCISVLLSYSVYAIFINKRPLIFIYVSLFTLTFFLLIWLLLYGNLSGILTYFKAMYEFSRDNSNAYQVDATNHWGLLCLALLSFYLPVLITKNELTRIFYLITVIFLYEAFRYSFGRQENWHQLFLFISVILLSAIFLLLNSNAGILVFLLPLTAISLLYANIIMTDVYNLDDKKRVTGIGNFITLLRDYPGIEKHTESYDSLILQDKVLDKQQRAIISNSTVDCYPTELTYIPANTLNWDPRPNLQILAYTPWLDSHNAAFFSTKQAPGYYIWELEQPPFNNYSPDKHYVLNDEPNTIFSFFNHYQLQCFSSKTALFKYNNGPLLSEEHLLKTTLGYFGNWMEVATCDSTSIVRAKIYFKDTFWGALRKTFYKDELYFIDYKLENGTIKSYRFIPGNAASGIWINPLVLDITKGLRGEKVKFIRLHTSLSGCVNTTFFIDWTTFHLK